MHMHVLEVWIIYYLLGTNRKMNPSLSSFWNLQLEHSTRYGIKNVLLWHIGYKYSRYLIFALDLASVNSKTYKNICMIFNSDTMPRALVCVCVCTCMVGECINILSTCSTYPHLTRLVYYYSAQDGFKRFNFILCKMCLWMMLMFLLH